MDEREMLYQAIVDDPNDDTRRLAYADCLDELEPQYQTCLACGGLGYTMSSSVEYDTSVYKTVQCSKCEGEGKICSGSFKNQAAFIRMQIKLANWSAEQSHSDFVVCKMAELQIWGQLIEPHTSIAPFLPYDETTPSMDIPTLKLHRYGIAFRRGFPEVFKIKAETWNKHGNQIIRLYPITQLIIVGNNDAIKGWKLVGAWKRTAHSKETTLSEHSTTWTRMAEW